MTLIKAKAKSPNEADGDDFAMVRNQHSYEAHAHMKQARRMEQIVFRIGLMEK